MTRRVEVGSAIRAAGSTIVIWMHLALILVTLVGGVYLASLTVREDSPSLMRSLAAIEAAVLASCVLVALRLRAWIASASRWPLIAADILLALVVGYVLIPLAFTEGLPVLVAVQVLAFMAAGSAALGHRVARAREGIGSVVMSVLASGTAVAAALLATSRIYG